MLPLFYGPLWFKFRIRVVRVNLNWLPKFSLERCLNLGQIGRVGASKKEEGKDKKEKTRTA
jgi:hypothetical protein